MADVDIGRRHRETGLCRSGASGKQNDGLDAAGPYGFAGDESNALPTLEVELFGCEEKMSAIVGIRMPGDSDLAVADPDIDRFTDAGGDIRHDSEVIAAGLVDDIVDPALQSRLADRGRPVDRGIGVLGIRVVDETIETEREGVHRGGVVAGQQLIDSSVAADDFGWVGGVTGHRISPVEIVRGKARI